MRINENGPNASWSRGGTSATLGSMGANRTLRVVVADDEPDVRALLGIALGLRGGFTVVGEAGDGAAAAALCDETHPDAIVLDLLMPGIDGFEAIDRIRALTPETKIVVFSALRAAQACEECLERGADAYVEKGHVVDDLPAAVERVCAGGPRLDVTRCRRAPGAR
jgi:DNA-binding NarL/FixJ family response regulator